MVERSELQNEIEGGVNDSDAVKQSGRARPPVYFSAFLLSAVSCTALREEDYDKLVGMIDADSINYSPSRTFSDSEIRMLLDQIRRGY